MRGLSKRTSAETAAAFLATYSRRARRPRRTAKAKPVTPPQQRFVIDVAPLTFAEILDCVVERASRYRRDGKPVPHPTSIALKMLHEATKR